MRHRTHRPSSTASRSAQSFVTHAHTNSPAAFSVDYTESVAHADKRIPVPVTEIERRTRMELTPTQLNICFTHAHTHSGTTRRTTTRRVKECLPFVRFKENASNLKVNTIRPTKYHHPLTQSVLVRGQICLSHVFAIPQSLVPIPILSD